MRDAVGGTVALVIISFFIVIALGYMAFNVNYTKAFRMKNKIISTYEEYNGKCDSSCDDIIKNYANTLGYSVGSLSCKDGYNKDSHSIYCYSRVDINNNSSDGIVDDSKKFYYKIITKINIEIPVINNLLDLQVFYITGDTKTFKE